MTDRTRDYSRSEAMLEAALEVIPLGAQTFSKSITQYPRGAAPFFIERAQGSRAWDVDGNEYVDFNNALCAVTLGHCDPDVTAAVVEQIGKGTIFTLSSPLEIDVARAIVEAVPCAEQVRFGKNGSDATAGCIRIARAFARRDRVAICGYHGWQDWYIGTTSRNLGVPEATRALSSTFRFNDLDSLHALFKAHPGEYAAVILEPVAFDEPAPGYHGELKELAHKNGALLVFDEVVTGFRFAPGSAQQLYGVAPDLTALGKGLANGFPLSAVTGRADVMRLMEEVFFSFTMGGETLSLAAAAAVLDKVRRESTLDCLKATGQRLLDGTRARIASAGVSGFLEIKGHPSWTLFVFRDTDKATSFELKTLFIQECCRRGVLNIGLHFIGHAHQTKEIDATLAVYDEVFPILAEAARKGARPLLDCEPLVPLFKVR